MKTRINFLDNLRTFLIFLVVVLHSGLVYESVLNNSWIVNDPVKNESIGLIRMYLDLFVMFTIFFISGYFVPISAKSKSALEFIKSKFKRIYLPWIIAVFTLIPAYKFIFLFSRGLQQEEWVTYFHFFQRTGTDLSFYANNPAQNWLWFLPVLFLFQIIYLALSKTRILSFNISLKTGVILTFVLGVIYSVAISSLGLKGWFDSALLHFQRERLLLYFMAFLLGTLCYKHKVFESTAKNKKLYIIANVVLTIALGIFTAVALNIFFNLIDPSRNFYYISEFADRVVYYLTALLSQLSFLYVMVYAFRYSFNKTNALTNELNRNSYSVYIIHTIVLGVVALFLMDFAIPVMLKYLILTLSTFALSNMLIYSWRLTKQKQVNMKTIATTVMVVLIIGAAFRVYPETTGKEQNTNTELESSVTQNTQSMHAAVISGKLEAIKQLIKSGADLNEKEPAGGSSPLMTACVFNQTEIALELINAGADLSVTNNDGSTALHTAAFFCRTKVVKTLLANGADKTIRNNAGSTAVESVLVPFEAVKGIYDYFGKVYEPLGLKLDYARIQSTRPVIAEMLK
ncbi:acyltransferase family protein [uncultured Draconibacterium sp.]|uniref:acyltransferase family protein n=1 Tax=uncultured Draconibacterium sp. TaxID=1573823 RepID=UPI003217E2B6